MLPFLCYFFCYSFLLSLFLFSPPFLFFKTCYTFQTIGHKRYVRWKTERKSNFSPFKHVGLYSVSLYVSVPDSKSRNIPEVVFVRRGAVGFWEFGKGGTVGWRVGKWGQFTSNLRRRWTIPVTAGGCQVSGRGHKGEAKGDQQGERKARELRHVYM